MESSKIDGNIDELKNLIKKLMIKNGFSEVIPLAERQDQLQKVEYVLISVWIILSLLILQDFKSRLLWILLVFPSIFIEQVLNLFYHGFLYFRKKKTIKGFPIKESLNRPIKQRFNILFFFLFFTISLVSNYLFIYPPYTFFYVIATTIAGSLYLSDKVSNTKSGVNFFLSLALGFIRAFKQIRSILNPVAPGIVLAFVVAAVSRDLWEFVNQVSWMQIAFMFALILLLMFMSRRFGFPAIMMALENEIRTMNLVRDSSLPEELYNAIIRCSSHSKSNTISQQLFNDYREYVSWKWQKPIYDIPLQDLIDELKKRINSQIQLGLLLLMPQIFGLMFILSAIIFPSNTLSEWSRVDTSLGFLITGVLRVVFYDGSLALIDWGRVMNNPITKFSAVSTLVLSANFFLSYAQDSKSIVSRLRLSNDKLQDLLTILCAYHVIEEYEFQHVENIWTSTGHGFEKISFIMPILLVPNNADRALIERVILRIKKWREANARYIYAIFIKTDDFYKTSIYEKLSSNPNEGFKKDTQPTSSSTPTCWVWMDQNGQAEEVFEFFSLDEAQSWISKR